MSYVDLGAYSSSRNETNRLSILSDKLPGNLEDNLIIKGDYPNLDFIPVFTKGGVFKGSLRLGAELANFIMDELFESYSEGRLTIMPETLHYRDLDYLSSYIKYYSLGRTAFDSLVIKMREREHSLNDFTDIINIDLVKGYLDYLYEKAGVPGSYTFMRFLIDYKKSLTDSN